MAGFDPKAYLSKKAVAAPEPQGFNPKAYLATRAKPEEPTPQSGAAQTAVEQFGQGALMGYLPQVQAGVERGIEKGLGLLGVGPSAVDAELRAQGFQVPERTYVQARDENIARLERQQKERPMLSMASQLGGGIAGSVGIGAGLRGAGLAAKAAPTVAGRLAQAGKVGAVAGAIQNPGDVAGEVSPLQLGDRASNALTGALTGAAFQGTGEAITGGIKAVGKAAKGAKDAAASFALKQVGANKRAFKELYKGDKIEELGDFVRKSGIIDGAPSPEEVLTRINSGRASAGKELDDIYAALNTDKVKVNPNEVVDTMLERVTSGKSAARPSLASDAKKFDEAVLQTISDVAAKGDDLKNPKVINDLIGEIDAKIKYNKQINEMPAIQQGLFEVRDSLRGYLKGLTKKVGEATGDAKLAERYLQANKNYSNYMKLRTMAEDKASSSAVNRLFSLTDYQSALGGGALGAGQALASGDENALARGLLVGGSAALANRFARRQGPGLLSKSGDILQGVATRAQPGLMANQNPVLMGLIGSQAAERKNKK